MALLCTDAGNINWFSHYGKEYEGSFLKKKKKKKIGKEKLTFERETAVDFFKKARQL